MKQHLLHLVALLIPLQVAISQQDLKPLQADVDNLKDQKSRLTADLSAAKPDKPASQELKQPPQRTLQHQPTASQAVEANPDNKIANELKVSGDHSTAIMDDPKKNAANQEAYRAAKSQALQQRKAGKGQKDFGRSTTATSADKPASAVRQAAGGKKAKSAMRPDTDASRRNAYYRPLGEESAEPSKASPASSPKPQH